MASRDAHRHTHRHAHEVARDPLAAGVSSRAERAATWLSLACAVHCLVMPVAISVMPLLGASGLTQLGPTAELVMTLLVVASALVGVVWGYRRHRDLRFVLATVLGLVAYLVGHAFEASWFGISLAVLGALTLAASSFLGAKLSHTHVHPTCPS
ncbi:MAG: hypothetical protein JWN48_1714 [Myxococcaceae bacterium]|nr:hypothetical protein [Myxococcaceae bacterium]